MIRSGTLARNRAVFASCVSQARRGERQGLLQAAAEWSDLAARTAISHPFRWLGSPELEASLLSIAAALPRPVPPRRDPDRPPRRWLHVLTVASPIGGHTALVRRWVELRYVLERPLGRPARPADRGARCPRLRDQPDRRSDRSPRQPGVNSRARGRAPDARVGAQRRHRAARPSLRRRAGGGLRRPRRPACGAAEPRRPRVLAGRSRRRRRREPAGVRARLGPDLPRDHPQLRAPHPVASGRERGR